jgi:hypothetical protein
MGSPCLTCWASNLRGARSDPYLPKKNGGVAPKVSGLAMSAGPTTATILSAGSDGTMCRMSGTFGGCGRDLGGLMVARRPEGSWADLWCS